MILPIPNFSEPARRSSPQEGSRPTMQPRDAVAAVRHSLPRNDRRRSSVLYMHILPVAPAGRNRGVSNLQDGRRATCTYLLKSYPSRRHLMEVLVSATFSRIDLLVLQETRAIGWMKTTMLAHLQSALGKLLRQLQASTLTSKACSYNHLHAIQTGAVRELTRVWLVAMPEPRLGDRKLNFRRSRRRLLCQVLMLHLNRPSLEVARVAGGQCLQAERGLRLVVMRCRFRRRTKMKKRNDEEVYETIVTLMHCPCGVFNRIIHDCRGCISTLEPRTLYLAIIRIPIHLFCFSGRIDMYWTGLQYVPSQ